MLAQVFEKVSILSHALVEPLQLLRLEACIRYQVVCIGHGFMISGRYDRDAIEDLRFISQ
jgi:hypothetical protein